MIQPRRMIIGISGATGVIYGVRLLQVLKQQSIETHLVVTKAGEMTRAYETDLSMQQLHGLADVCYPVTDVGAAISSGSFRTMGMIIAPCSIRTMSEIASGISSNLLTRAADVVLKERRRLVLMLRETPLTAGHIKSMLAVTESGGIIAPPVPAFYIRPQTIDELVDHAIGRVLDLFDIEMAGVQRWGGPAALAEEAESVGIPVRSHLNHLPGSVEHSGCGAAMKRHHQEKEDEPSERCTSLYRGSARNWRTPNR